MVRRHRSSVLRFLKETGLSIGLRELIEVEMRLGKKTESDRKHAAYSARNLMEEVADHLFPSTSKTHMDRSSGEHSLGAKDHKNRLIAFVEKRLEGQLDGHDFRAFVATMDAVMRWTGKRTSRRLHTRACRAFVHADARGLGNGRSRKRSSLTTQAIHLSPRASRRRCKSIRSCGRPACSLRATSPS